MPRQYYQQPQADDEPLSQLLQLAQFAHIVGGQQVDQQQLEQQDQHQRVQAALTLLGLQQQKEVAAQTAKNEDAQRALEKLGIEEVAKSRDATVKGNVADSLISHFSADPANHKLLASALEGLDFPQLAQGYKKQYEANIKDRAAKILPALTAAHGQGDKQYQAILSTVAGDEDLMAALKPHLPQDTAPEPPKSVGTKLGTTVRQIGTAIDPLSALTAITRGGYDFGKSNAPDFWNALLNKKPQPTQ